MNFLILHRIPYHKIEYHRGLCHHKHHVVYLGSASALENIPQSLSATKIARDNDSLEACLKALKKHGPMRFDRVISMSEYELLLAAQLRQKLGDSPVPGPSVEEVLLVRDKISMKEAIQTGGIRVPRHIRTNRMTRANKRAFWQGRTVLKPTDGASSSGVKVYASFDDAWVAASEIEESARGDWELEEFVAGEILHFDGLVIQGRLAAVTASQYIGTCLKFLQGYPLGSVQIPMESIYEPAGVEPWIESCLRSVKHLNGTFHLEAIATPDGLVFLEVAARVGGADVVATFELATGLHLPSVELTLISGSKFKLPELSRIQKQYFGWFVFPKHLSILNSVGEISVEGVESLQHNPRVVSWQQRTVKVSADEKLSYQAQDSPLAGIVASNSSADLASFVRTIFRSAKVHVRSENFHQ